MKTTETELHMKMLEMGKLLNIYLNHFPKHEQHALCRRMRDSFYQVYDLITEGRKRYHKKTTLTQLDVAHEQLRMQAALAFELGYFRYKTGKKTKNTPDRLESHRYLALSSLIDQVGKMIGKWMKQHMGQPS